MSCSFDYLACGLTTIFTRSICRYIIRTCVIYIRLLCSQYYYNNTLFTTLLSSGVSEMTLYRFSSFTHAHNIRRPPKNMYTVHFIHTYIHNYIIYYCKPRTHYCKNTESNQRPPTRIKGRVYQNPLPRLPSRFALIGSK